MPPTPKSDAGLSSPGMHRRDGQTGAQRRGGPEARSQHRIADRATASRCVPLGGEIRLGSRCLAPSELRVGVRARRARTRTGGAAICTCLVPLGQHVLQRPTRCTGIGGKKVSRIFRIHDRITISYSFPIWLGYAASFLFSREHSKICPSHRFVTGVRFTLLPGGRAHRSQAGPASCDMPRLDRGPQPRQGKVPSPPGRKTARARVAGSTSRPLRCPERAFAGAAISHQHRARHRHTAHHFH